MLKPNKNLLNISTLSDSHKYPPVCVSEFTKSGYSLYYINARHVGNLDNPTCKTIEKALDIYAPQTIVVECGGGGAGPYFDKYKSYLLDHVKKSHRADNECAYTTLLALERNIPIANGEPTDKVILKDLMDAGYTSKDIQAFGCLQWLGQEIRRERIDHLSFYKKTTTFFKNQKEILSLHNRDSLTLPEYREWFSKHYPKRTNLLNVSSNDTAPERSKDATLAHKISYDTNRTRDPHIVQTITDMLDLYQSVLVVYGSGHLETQRKVFEDMLGPCQERVLVPEHPSPTTKQALHPTP